MMLKHCFYLNFFTMGELTARLKLPTNVITPGLNFLRHEKFLELRGPDPLKPASNALGPALMSGKPLFLYGSPGNGKTSIAMRMGEIWDDVILVPYALYVAGNVIRVFGEISHRPLAANGNGNGNGNGMTEQDLRWVPCQRPTVIVGGELTLDMLDLAFNPTLKYFEAPLQLKANNSLFITPISCTTTKTWRHIWLMHTMPGSSGP